MPWDPVQIKTELGCICVSSPVKINRYFCQMLIQFNKPGLNYFRMENIESFSKVQLRKYTKNLTDLYFVDKHLCSIFF